ncbi:caspase domain-containing protein [Micromonospora sp. NPDC018662]|uniref:caspase domain-containing protein n=1 Tax=Micromonospora sp. NPDC018662 TaxID=3364238 RepID=UPI0037BA3989
MSRRVFALLVGIDSYRAATSLQGAGHDVLLVERFLRERHPEHDPSRVRVLRDGQATRAAVIAGLRGHLGEAGPGDTALFWFSGHGSCAPVPAELWHLEPNGEMQTLVCHDSRSDGVPELYDKELSLILGEIAATGCHLVVVLDSCHSQSATRNPRRSLPPVKEAPLIEALLPELLRAAARPPMEYVVLTACRSFEAAIETWVEGRPHGLFTWSLIGAMRRLGPSATYRELLAAARCEVERYVYQQVPQLEPVTAGVVDQPFLGGHISPAATGMRMRRVRHDWEIDVGSCHGLVAHGDDDIRVAVPGPDLHEARVVRIHPERSVVRPIGWEPDDDRQYPVVLSRVPTPATTVAVEAGHRPTLDLVLTALETAGPGGGASPHVRVLALDDGQRTPELRLTVVDRDRVRVCDAEDAPLCADLTDVSRDGGRRVAAVLEHLARVKRVRSLVNPVSTLVEDVSLELVEAGPGEVVAPADRPPLRPGGDGAVHLRYRRENGGWVPPTVFVRMRNDGDRRLYYVLLDVTERHRVHAGLFPGAHVAPRHAAAALHGRPVELRLPPGRPVAPGAVTRDWLVLLAAEQEFTSSPFELPAVDQVWPGRTRAPLAVSGLLGRLGLAAVHRDAGAAEAGACDWVTAVLPVVTEVPEAAR